MDYININDNKINTSISSIMKNSMESLIHHFKLFSEGINST